MNLYFDNASTSYPKPHEVVDAITNFMTNVGGSYGRSSHKRAYITTSLIEECRDMIGMKLGAENGNNIAWSKNATEASNIIISSLDLRNKTVLVSPLEHNCTMRPLTAAGAIIKVMPHFSDGRIDCTRLKTENAVLAVINHQSNVNGVIQPIEEIRNRLPHTPIMLDTAQSLGQIEVNVKNWDIDYAIFTGHKGLFGPTGTGGLYVKNPNNLKPLLYGGTGSNSLSYAMPTVFPEFLEAGTYNNMGLIGLKAALESDMISNHTRGDFLDMMAEMKQLDGVRLISANESDYQGELFSFIHDTTDGAKIAFQLNELYDIDCRFGLHCSALSHTTLHTTTSGTVRVSLSALHFANELEYFVESVSKLIKFK